MSFEMLGGENLPSMPPKILRGGLAPLGTDDCIMNKNDNGVDYDDEERREDGT